MKKINVLTAVLASLLLAACGGGDEVVLTAPAPAAVASAPVAKAEADVTIRQVQSRQPALPGQTMAWATVATITCKGMSDTGACPSSTPLGEIVIIDETGGAHELSGFKLLYLGQEVEGWVQNEGGGKYRFRSNTYLYIYQAGSLGVQAIVSPWAPDGTVHTLSIKTVSAAYDKVVEVVPAKAELVVRADPAYQPVELSTNSSGYINPNADGSLVTVNFTVRAGTQTSNSFASLDFGWVRGLVPDTAVTICRYQGGLGDTPECFNYGNVDRWGEFYLSFGLEPQFGGATTTYQVSFTPAQPTYLVAQQVEAWVNGVQIAPRIVGPEAKFNECSALANRYCKGVYKSPERKAAM